MFALKGTFTNNNNYKPYLKTSEESTKSPLKSLSSKDSKVLSTQTGSSEKSNTFNKIYENFEKSSGKRDSKTTNSKSKESFLNKTSENIYKDEFYRLKKVLEDKNAKEQIYLRKIVNLEKENNLLKELLKESENLIKKVKNENYKLNKNIENMKNKLQTPMMINKEVQVQFNKQNTANFNQNDKIDSYIQKLTQKLSEIESASKQILLFDNGKNQNNNENFIEDYKNKIEFLEKENEFLNLIIERNSFLKIHPKIGFNRLLEIKNICN